MPVRKIFVDLDDVLNELTIPALQHIGCRIANIHQYKPEWGWDIAFAASELLGQPQQLQETFWGQYTEDFWRILPVSDLCYPLLQRCDKLVGEKNVCILTRPTNHGSCLSGKLKWINDHVPTMIHNYLIGCPKHLCASPDALLIDDSEENVRRFRHYGGQAILVPRPWNALHSIKDPNQYVLKEIYDDCHTF
jgi:5'(3')-deoxyribonucleotidase